jgi:hypothetical protein
MSDNSYLRNEKPSCQKTESANFLEENFRGLRNISQKSRKGQISKKLLSKSKKLELNCTNLQLKSKKTRSDCAKMPNPSVNSGLKVKNKTIRVLLDSGSSGDLLFMKKGSSKHVSIVKRVVPVWPLGHYASMSITAITPVWPLCQYGHYAITPVRPLQPLHHYASTAITPVRQYGHYAIHHTALQVLKACMLK